MEGLNAWRFESRSAFLSECLPEHLILNLNLRLMSSSIVRIVSYLLLLFAGVASWSLREIRLANEELVFLTQISDNSSFIRVKI